VKAIVIAGGEGRRMEALARGTPKPLLAVGERAIIEHQIALCRRYDIREIHLTVRHTDLPAFRERLGAGEAFGVTLEYRAEREPLGTAGGAAPILRDLGDDALVLYGDVMVNMDLGRLAAFHASRQALATLVVHPTDHPLDSDLVEIAADGRIRAFRPTPRPAGLDCRNIGNAGAYVLSSGVAGHIPAGPNDFIRDVFPRALAAGAPLFGYAAREYLKDTGTPERLAAVRADHASGRIRERHQDVALPAVFLDRDGTLCELVPLLHRVEEMRLLDGAAEAVRRVNAANWLAVVVTNQPVVARALCTPGDVERIHARLEMLLGRQGAVLDAVYYCPHHPDAGYEGEVADLKTACECRKPGGALIRRAARDLHIDLARSVLIGDTTVDLETARRLGLAAVLVQTGHAGADAQFAVQPNAVRPDVAAAVDWALSGAGR